MNKRRKPTVISKRKFAYLGVKLEPIELCTRDCTVDSSEASCVPTIVCRVCGLWFHRRCMPPSPSDKTPANLCSECSQSWSEDASVALDGSRVADASTDQMVLVPSQVCVEANDDVPPVLEPKNVVHATCVEADLNAEDVALVRQIVAMKCTVTNALISKSGIQWQKAFNDLNEIQSQIKSRLLQYALVTTKEASAQTTCEEPCHHISKCISLSTLSVASSAKRKNILESPFDSGGDKNHGKRQRNESVTDDPVKESTAEHTEQAPGEPLVLLTQGPAKQYVTAELVNESSTFSSAGLTDETTEPSTGATNQEALVKIEESAIPTPGQTQRLAAESVEPRPPISSAGQTAESTQPLIGATNQVAQVVAETVEPRSTLSSAGPTAELTEPSIATTNQVAIGNITSSPGPTLRRTLRTTGDMDRPFICPYCGFAQRTGGHLREHLANKHNITQLFGCSVCKIQFSFRAQLLDHHAMFKHSGMEKLLVGPNDEILGQALGDVSREASTGKQYTDQVTWLPPVEDRLKPHKCNACGANFRRITMLRQHEASAHGIRMIYICRVCSQEFAKYPDFLVHRSNEKHYGHDRKFVADNRKDFVDSSYVSALYDSFVSEGASISIDEVAERFLGTDSVAWDHDSVLVERYAVTTDASRSQAAGHPPNGRGTITDTLNHGVDMQAWHRPIQTARRDPVLSHHGGTLFGMCESILGDAPNWTSTCTSLESQVSTREADSGNVMFVHVPNTNANVVCPSNWDSGSMDGGRNNVTISGDAVVGNSSQAGATALQIPLDPNIVTHSHDQVGSDGGP